MEVPENSLQVGLLLEEFSVDQVVNEERAFLHDISTPIMVIRLTLENMVAAGQVPTDLNEKFDRALRSIANISDKIEERRGYIKTIQKQGK